VKNLEKKTSVGANMLTFVSCLVLVGAGWGNTQTRLNSLEKDVASYRTDVELTLKQIEINLAHIQVQQAKIATDIIWIKEKISEQ